MSCDDCDYGPESGPYCSHWSDPGSCDECAMENETVRAALARMGRTLCRLRALADGYRDRARRAYGFALRCQWQAADILDFVRSEERARIVAALRDRDCPDTADAIERGEL